MFAARGAGISLAVFVLLYVPASLLVSRMWRLLRCALNLRSARQSVDFLFVLRILPFALALVFTLVFTLPSFLLLEPRSTDENIGTLPILLGAACLLLLLAGTIRTTAAQRRSSRAITQWLDGSALMEPCSTVPVFRTGKNAPGLTVAGVRDPKVLVSEAAVAALTAAELRTALQHEMAHVRFYDNLKKLIFRLSAFPGMGGLESAWLEEAELAADDAAVSSLAEALDLAAALIKVSRLSPVVCAAELTTGLLHSSTALGRRVQRLCSWQRIPYVPGRGWFYILPPAAATLFAVVVSYSSALDRLHALTEWLVR